MTDIDIHAYLAQKRQIAAVWSVEDVLAVRDDLTEDQAWSVLRYVERAHDANLGISWETLQSAAQCLFGDQPRTDSK